MTSPSAGSRRPRPERRPRVKAWDAYADKRLLGQALSFFASALGGVRLRLHWSRIDVVYVQIDDVLCSVIIQGKERAANTKVGEPNDAPFGSLTKAPPSGQMPMP